MEQYLKTPLKSWRADDMLDDTVALASTLRKNFEKLEKRKPTAKEDSLLRVDAFSQCATHLNVQLLDDMRIITVKTAVGVPTSAGEDLPNDGWHYTPHLHTACHMHAHTYVEMHSCDARHVTAMRNL